MLGVHLLGRLRLQGVVDLPERCVSSSRSKLIVLLNVSCSPLAFADAAASVCCEIAFFCVGRKLLVELNEVLSI